MDDPIHKGSLPPFQNADVVTYTHRVGETIERSSLVLLANIKPFTDNLKAQGFSFHVEPLQDTPYALVTWIPWDAQTQVNILWERAGNSIEKDIWESPQIRAEFTKLILAPGISPDFNIFYQWHAFIQRVVLGKVEGAEEVPSWKRETDGTMKQIPILTDAEFKAAFTMINSEAGLPATVNGSPVVAVGYLPFAKLAGCIARGVTSFPVATYAYRKVQILPKGFTVGTNPMVPNAIYTLAEFVTGASPPAEFAALMPVGYYQYQAPTISGQRDGTFQLNEEWYYAKEYDSFIYDNFRPPATVELNTGPIT